MEDSKSFILSLGIVVLVAVGVAGGILLYPHVRPLVMTKKTCQEYGTFEVDKKDVLQLYREPGITTYVKARGTIYYSPKNSVFSILALGSSTGPFTITPKVQAMIENIPDGSCVEMFYGSRGSDPDKVIFEIKRQ